MAPKLAFSYFVMISESWSMADFAFTSGGTYTDVMMTDVNSHGRQKGRHLIDRVSSSGVHDFDSTFTLAHHKLFTRKHTPPPLFLFASLKTLSALNVVKPGIFIAESGIYNIAFSLPLQLCLEINPLSSKLPNNDIQLMFEMCEKYECQARVGYMALKLKIIFGYSLYRVPAT